MLLFKGRRVVLPGGEVRPASIRVSGGKIIDIVNGYIPGEQETDYEKIIDAGDYLLMPGVVDSHVHVNEPGRTPWEGYDTATKAGAAGGITTIVDMPLNSLPSTTSSVAFKTKIEAAQGKLNVDVGFWGGVVPGNQSELSQMLAQGVCGFKCFMIDSGVDEFPYVTEADIRGALEKLRGTDGRLLFHAEVDLPVPGTEENDPKKYKTFLDSRPDSWEVEAIDRVCKLCLEYGVPCHIVHLSAAGALPLVQKAKEAGARLTIETTHHYLTLAAEDIPDGATEYKCCPPIRSKENQRRLWEAVRSGLIDMVVSDHSPCTADLKLLDKGDFMKAWGGIASVQFGLPLFWTGCKQYDLNLSHVITCLCEAPAKLAGLQKRKGQIAVGMDADFVIWNPDDYTTIDTNSIYHKNKVTPFLNKKYNGKVLKTFVRGSLVYENGSFAEKPQGEALLLKHLKMKL
ncbi:hypothetical protein LSH36_76g02020 [Paralvinella palmiformis]|uniref:allantoinase n=1 Tax=Paralvinella palmiformis TaxID=53620 RepID=A0AAD9K2C5_9ANNE|nr:hypothetical protein LSH36_76g02020 [Paralvinella palmiformis]